MRSSPRLGLRTPASTRTPARCSHSDSDAVKPPTRTPDSGIDSDSGAASSQRLGCGQVPGDVNTSPEPPAPPAGRVLRVAHACRGRAEIGPGPIGLRAQRPRGRVGGTAGSGAAERRRHGELSTAGYAAIPCSLRACLERRIDSDRCRVIDSDRIDSDRIESDTCRACLESGESTRTRAEGRATGNRIQAPRQQAGSQGPGPWVQGRGPPSIALVSLHCPKWGQWRATKRGRRKSGPSRHDIDLL